jgi:Tfp pilus assembly protein PilO
LAALGLEDRTARRDMDELRELLGTWRDVKKSAWQTVARWIVRILLAILMVSIAYQSDLSSLLEK